MRPLTGHVLCAASFAVALACNLAAVMASAAAESEPGLITQRVDEHSLARLPGNVRLEAIPNNDRGRVSDSIELGHMQLQLRRSYAREQALETFIDQLHTQGSPQFHRWLKPQQFGEQFGAAKSDTAAITHWLEGHGFTVNQLYPSRMLIDFSGTARQVREAFHTEIHQQRQRT